MNLGPIPIDIFFDLLLAPFKYQDMLWILVPLIISVALMEVYYGRYKHEEIGWSSVFGNSVVLIFVSIDLFRHLYGQGTLGFTDFRNLLAIGIMLEGFVLTMIGFLHVLPKKFAFSLGSKLPTSLIAYMAIILIYAPVEINLWVILFSVIIVVGLTLLLGSFRSIIPQTFDVSEEEAAPKPEE